MDVGHKIYYDLATGNVVFSTSEMSGPVVETTKEQDFQLYTALRSYQQDAVGVILCEYGQDSDNFAKYPFHVDITKVPIDASAIIWDTDNPMGATLEQVKQVKIAQITDFYNQTLEEGFISSCTGSPLVYDYSVTSQAKWSKLFIGLSVTGAIPDAAFPLNITLKDGTVMPHTRAQLTQLCGDVSLWELQLEAKYQSYTSTLGSIMSATTIDQVNAINW